MTAERACPGCALGMPRRSALTAHGYYNASPECWSVYTEVLGAEYSNAVLFGQVHQLTVDAYAVQHAGGRHPDKSVAVHLAGLYLTLDCGVRPTSVPSMLQRLASANPDWPHYTPPRCAWQVTVFDVALAAGEFEVHARIVRAWSESVWQAWSDHHASVAAFLDRELGLIPDGTFLKSLG
jgi:hypothetical protein